MGRKIKTAYICAALMSILLSPSYGAIYQYRDEYGRLFLTDNPPNNKYKIVFTTSKDCKGPDNYACPSNGIDGQHKLLPSEETFAKHINEAADAHSLDPYLIKSIIKVESDFDPKAKSKRGACGLMQLMPATARLVGCSDPYDAYDNIMGGSEYFRMMLNRFDGKVDMALAAYNAGPGNVDKYGGIPPFRETKNYIKRVNHYYYQYLNGKPASGKSLPTISSDLSRRLGSAYKKFSDGNTEGAVSDYREIAALYPHSAQALYNLACILDMNKNYEEALDIYQSALKQDPYLDKALYNIAVIYENMGQHKNSIKTWKKYIQITRNEDKIVMAERYIKELTEYSSLK